MKRHLVRHLLAFLSMAALCAMLPSACLATAKSIWEETDFIPLTLGKPEEVTITRSGDIAFFSYTPEKTDYYSFYASDGSNPLLGIYDASKQRVNSEDDSMGGASSLCCKLSAGQLYYFSMQPRNSRAGNITCSVALIKSPTSGKLTGGLTWSVSGKGLLSIKGTGPIPDFEYANYAPWNRFSDSIVSLSIDNGITSIGDNAFVELQIERADLPKSIRRIGSGAFYRCEKLTQVNLPSGITAIGDEAFFSCRALERISIPSGVTTIGKEAFFHNVSLEEVHLPDTLKSIGSGAFMQCEFIQEIVFPKGLQSIGDEAFESCEMLENLSLPNNLTQIGINAFCRCKGLTRVSIPGKVKRIGDGAFSYCPALRSATLQEGVLDIGRGAFYESYYLLSVTIPKSIRTIEDDAFRGCTLINSVSYAGTAAQWKKIKIGTGNGTVSAHVSSGVVDSGTIGNLSWKVTASGTLTVSGSGKMTDFNAELSGFGQTVGSSSPWNTYKNLVNKLVLSKGVTSIGNYAFVCFDELESLSLPDGLKHIGDYAFYRARLFTLPLPTGLKSIGSFALSDISALQALDLPEGLTSIGANLLAFSSVRVLTLPVSLKAIPDYAFSDCDTLWHLKYNGTKKQWSKVTIGAGNDSLTKAEMHYGTGSETDSGTCGNGVKWALNSSGTLTISGKGPMKDYTLDNPFSFGQNNRSNAPWIKYNYEIKKIVVGSGVTRVGSNAFFNCFNARSVSLADTVQSIGEYAMYATNIRSIRLPDSVKSLEVGVFGKCAQLSSVSLSPNIKDIPRGTFSDCTGLEILVLPKGVKTIADYAFSGSGIKDLTIPATVVSMGDPTVDMGLYSSATQRKTLRFRGALPKGLYNAALKNTDIYCPPKYYKDYRDYLMPYVMAISSSRNLREDLGILCGGTTQAKLSETQLIVGEKSGVTRLSVTVGGTSKGLTVKWHSSNPELMTISKNGVISLKGYSGAALAYAEVSQKGETCLAFCRVEFVHSQINSLLLNTLPTKNIKANYLASNSVSPEDHYGNTVGYLPAMYVETNKNNTYYRELESLVRSLTKNASTDREKTANILSWVCSNIKYASPPLCIGESPAQVYEVYVNRIGNCQGYSKLTGFMLSLANIPCGTVTNSGHMWNIAFLDGKWTMVDSESGSISLYSDFKDWLHQKVKTITFAQGDCIFMVDTVGEVKLAGVGVHHGMDQRAGLTSISIPNYVDTIFGYALEDCANLKKVNIPKSVKRIGTRAFAGCSSLKSVTIPKTVASIADDAFEGCNNLSIRCYRGSAAYLYALRNRVKYVLVDGPEKILTLPAALNRIEKEAFANLKDVDRIIIPAGVKSIADNAFKGTTAVLQVARDSYAESWARRNGFDYIYQ